MRFSSGTRAVETAARVRFCFREGAVLGAAFTGAIDNANTGSVSVSLDSTSVWNVTADSYVSSISSAKSDFSNIKSNGYTIYYDSSVCTSLGGKTIALTDGGKLAPM